jgi:hypothetical protein
MLFLLLLPFLLNLFSLHPSTSSNWAQVSGPKLQNNAQCERTPWEARWGLFSAVLQKQRPAACLGQVTPTMNILSEEEIAAEKAKGQDAGTSADDQLIMIMGGDDYNRYDGGGYFFNDVWTTPGILWKSIVSTVEKTKWGEPLAKIQAEMTWKKVRSNSAPPSGVDYKKWIACSASRVTYSGIICNENEYETVGGVSKWHEGMKCECPSSEYDKYPARSWGGRRDAAAIGFGRLIYVIGGRSRAMSDIPVSETIGGIYNDIRLDGFTREKSVLMNDVWSSPDGQNWKLETPGCGGDHMQEQFNEIIDPNTGQYEYPSTYRDVRGFRTSNGEPYPSRSWERVKGENEYPQRCRETIDCRPRKDELGPSLWGGDMGYRTLGSTPANPKVQKKFPDILTWGKKVMCKHMCSDQRTWCDPLNPKGRHADCGYPCDKHEECGKYDNGGCIDDAVNNPSRNGCHSNPFRRRECPWDELKCGKTPPVTCEEFGKCVEPLTHRRAECAIDADCGGASKCIDGGCVCQIWQPREKHAVAVFPALPLKPLEDCETNHPGGFDSRIYVFGGFTERYTHKCEKKACGGRYREYTNDVWRTKKDCSETQLANDPVGCTPKNERFGQSWELVTVDSRGPKEPLWRARGSHKVLVHQNKLWLMGGRGGHMRKANDNPLFNDVWSSKDGLNWELVMKNAEWDPRDEFTAGVLSPTDEYGPTKSVMIVFGGNQQVDGLGISGDVWISENGTYWVKDYSNETEHYDYVAADSDLSKLGTLSDEEIKLLNAEGVNSIQELAEAETKIVYKMKTGDYEIDPSSGPSGWRGGPFYHVCPHKKRAEQIMRQCTVTPPRIDGDDERSYCLPSSTLYPDEPRESVVGERCCAKESQECAAVSENLVVIEDINGQTPQEDLQLNSAGGSDGCEHPRWMESEQILRKPEDLLDEKNDKRLIWDIGRLKCIYETFDIPAENYAYENVPVCSPHPVMTTCKVSPPARRSMASVVQGGRFYVFGGAASDKDFVNDMWYRDERIPIAQFDGPIDPGAFEGEGEVQEFRPTPKTGTVDKFFSFTGDEAGIIFEYHLWYVKDVETFGGIEETMNRIRRRMGDFVLNHTWFTDVSPLGSDAIVVKRNWTRAIGGKTNPIMFETFIAEVGSDKQPFTWFQGEMIKGEEYFAGGLHIFAVRCIDPAGNFDRLWSAKNVHVWIYLAPLPGGLIVGVSLGVVFSVIAFLLELRRRKRKRAMERYAIKRMRRKFKGMQRGGPAGVGAAKKDGNINWKAYAADAKK